MINRHTISFVGAFNQTSARQTFGWSFGSASTSSMGHHTWFANTARSFLHTRTVIHRGLPLLCLVIYQDAEDISKICLQTEKALLITICIVSTRRVKASFLHRGSPRMQSLSKFFGSLCLRTSHSTKRRIPNSKD